MSPSPPGRTSIAVPIAFLTCKYPLTSCNASLDINHTLSSSSPSFTTTEHLLSDFRRGWRPNGEAVTSVRLTESDDRADDDKGESVGANECLREELAAGLLVAGPADLRGLEEMSARVGRSASDGELSRGDANKRGSSLPFPFNPDNDGGESSSSTRRVVQGFGSASCSARLSEDFNLCARLFPREQSSGRVKSSARERLRTDGVGERYFL